MGSANLLFSGCIATVIFTAATAASFCDPAYVVNNGRVWTVFPTGSDDSENLECAFEEAVAAGSGSTVKMVAAHYFLSRPIAVLYEGDLTWKGAGKNKTVLQAGCEGVLFPLLVEEGYFPEPGLPSVFVFHQDADGWVGPGGKELTSRLSFHGFSIRLRGLSQPWVDSFGRTSQSRSIIDVIGRIDGLRNFNLSRVNLTVSGVQLQAEVCDPEICGQVDWTALNGLTVGGESVTTVDENGALLIEYSKPIVADTRITNSLFQSIAYAVVNSDVEDSHILVNNNRFIDAGVAYFLQDADGGRVVVSNNRMLGLAYYGVITTHGLTGVFGYDTDPIPERFPDAPTELTIRRNTLQCDGIAEGVVIEDYTTFDLPDDQHMLDASISQNRISLAGGASTGVGSYYSRGVTVAGNRITGEGATGLYALYASGWTIRENFFNVTSGVPIWLQEPSTDFIVTKNTIRGYGADAAIQIDGSHHRVESNNVKQYQPGFAHFWLTASSANNHVAVSKKDTVQDDGTDNTVVVSAD